MCGSAVNGFIMGDGFGSAATGVIRPVREPSGFQVSGLEEDRTVGAGRRAIGVEFYLCPVPRGFVLFYACQLETLIVQYAPLGGLGSSVGRAED